MDKKQLLTTILFALTSMCLAQIAPTPADFLCDRPLFSEGFEGGIPAGWTGLNVEMAKTGGFNEGWVRDMGMTFTNNTGPTGAQEGTYYAYCDGSGPIARGDSAILTTSLINIGLVTSPALLFHLNMFGQSGVLYVSIIEGGSKQQVLGPISGAVPGGIHAADEWEEIFIDLSAYRDSDIQIEFLAMKPTDASVGDIAIDNLRICTSSNAVPTMGEWGIICVFLLIMIFGVVSLKNPSFRTTPS